MRIVVTYLHKGNDEYPALIRKAFKSAKFHGYETVTVGNMPLGDIHIDFGGHNEPHLMNWILAAQLEYLEKHFTSPSVLFSPDAIINKPLDDVFDEDFDVAFTERNNPKWPINNGVIFVKGANVAPYWRECLRVCKTYPSETQDWYGDQLSLHDVWKSGFHIVNEIKVRMLPCSIYNASPKHGVMDEKMLKEAYVIHFKGGRKSMMDGYLGAVCR